MRSERGGRKRLQSLRKQPAAGRPRTAPRPLARDINCSMGVCCMAQRLCPGGGIQACFPPERASLRRLARHSAAAEPRACSDARRSRGGALPTACAVEAMAAAAMSNADMGKALWDAVEAGNTGEVTRLLVAGAPVNWDVRVSTGACTAGAGVIGGRGGSEEERVDGWFQHLSATA